MAINLQGYRSHLALTLSLASLTTLLSSVFISSAFAQSANLKQPAPLQPGVNSAVIGNEVPLSHYYYFTGMPGTAQLTLNFSSAGFVGGGGSIKVMVLDDKGRQLNRYELKSTGQVLNSNAKAAQLVIPGKFNKKAKYIIRLDPPGEGLLRAAGTYEIEVTGSVQFDSIRRWLEQIRLSAHIPIAMVSSNSCQTARLKLLAAIQASGKCSIEISSYIM